MKTAVVFAVALAILGCGALADHHLGGHVEKKVGEYSTTALNAEK
jgi:hypothetical protein